MSVMSKLPWRYRPNKHDDWGFVRSGEELVAIGCRQFPATKTDEEHRSDGTDPCEANARHIVKCVNAHDELVAVIQRALLIAEDIDCVPTEAVMKFIMDATAALSKAKETL